MRRALAHRLKNAFGAERQSGMTERKKNMITTVCLNPSFDKTAVLSELKPGELNRLEQVRVDLGGKGLNVATVLSRLGVQTRCVGCLGRENASLFLQMVERERLTFEYMTVAGEVRTNLKLCEKTSKAITEINEPGPSVSEDELGAFLSLLKEKVQDSSYVVFSGSLPQNCGEDTYQRCIHSLLGGVLMGLARGVPLEDAFRFGVAAGAASVMTDGTQLLKREDFENLVPRVTVQEV